MAPRIRFANETVEREMRLVAFLLSVFPPCTCSESNLRLVSISNSESLGNPGPRCQCLNGPRIPLQPLHIRERYLQQPKEAEKFMRYSPLIPVQTDIIQLYN